MQYIYLNEEFNSKGESVGIYIYGTKKHAISWAKFLTSGKSDCAKKYDICTVNTMRIETLGGISVGLIKDFYCKEAEIINIETIK